MLSQDFLMPTLYVENIPDDLYEALCRRARARRRSIAEEGLALLEENIPTEQELKHRHNLLRKLIRMHEKRTNSGRHFPLPKKCCARTANGDPDEMTRNSIEGRSARFLIRACCQSALRRS